MMQTFNDKVEKYFGERLGWGPVKVREAKRLMGGISRETWKMSLDTISAGTSGRRDIILRLDPATSLLESNRNIEYAMLNAFESAPGVPVPQALCNEDDPSYLGASFMATALIPGVADISAVMSPPFSAVGRQIALAHFDVLGAITRFDPGSQSFERLMAKPSLASAAADALAHWEGVLRGANLGPAPITEAAIRHLKRHLPPPASKICVVHGDYRLGNSLFLPDGTLSGVLDWEMAHLGDPLEDLAWALHPDWRPGAAPAHLVAGHITEDEAIATWEAASGLRADPSNLAWWRLFTCVKAAAIFTTGAYNFTMAGGGDPVYALSAWFNLDGEETQMLGWMGVKV